MTQYLINDRIKKRGFFSISELNQKHLIESTSVCYRGLKMETKRREAKKLRHILLQQSPLRFFLPFLFSCLIFLSCKKAENSSRNLILSHYQDTIGGRLILKGGPFVGELSSYTVVFNDRETKPSQRFSSKEIEVIIPVNARTGIVKLKSTVGEYQTLDSFYVVSSKRWKRAADFPGEGRILATAFVIGTKAYVATGANKFNGSFFKDLWEYDSIRDLWSRKADFPGIARYMTLSFTLNGKGYVGGGMELGSSCARDLYEYTPESNTWRKMANAPEYSSICYGSASTFQGQGYVLAESEGHKTMIFNASSNTWTTNTSQNFGILIQDGTSFVLNDRLFYGMGTAQIPWSGLGSFTNVESYSYSYSTNLWRREDQHVPSDDQSVFRNAFVQNGEAYIAFGDGGKLYAYNPLTADWRKVTDQSLGVSSRCSNFMIGSKGFVVFGHKRFQDSGSKKLWMIELSSNPFVR